jgi:SAM-dependent methyltransferase/uncharacterized protein YbaR (Trm112 family)
MRLQHFEALRPICPSCKINGITSQLTLQPQEHDDKIVASGLIKCRNSQCGKTYPILFGCPLLVPDVESWLSANIHIVLQREITDPFIENYIGDMISPDIFFNISRQQQSSYCIDHYCEELSSPNASAGESSRQSSILSCLDTVLARMPVTALPCIDLGCAVGGTTFHLAHKRQALTLGIDMNWPLLSIGRKIMTDGVISFPRRLIGDQYERININYKSANGDLCDFWIADATCLPFEDNLFGLAIGFNLLDCVHSAQSLLREILRIIDVGGAASIATPLDWGSHATPKKNWIGDASELDNLIVSATLESDIYTKGFKFMAPAYELPWRLTLHERSTIHYLTRAYVLEVIKGGRGFEN